MLATGSHPSGHRLVASLGHELVPPVPSLFTVALENHPLATLAGVSMDPVVLELLQEGGRAEGASSRSSAKRVQGNRPQRGAVLITHWGLSGPATLKLTAFAARDLKEARYRGCLQVDWTGGLSPQAIDGLFQRAREEQARRLLINARPWPALSRRLWGHLLDTHGVEADRRWADLAKGQRRKLIQGLRASRYTISRRGPFGEEFVTAGGVPLNQVNLTSMQSRLNPNLYLVGELLNVDGVTGGFNFQHCWSGGWLAGQALAAQQASVRS